MFPKKIKDLRCPNCNILLNGISRIDGTNEEAVKDDISICIECGQLLSYQVDGFIPISPNELLGLIHNGEISKEDGARIFFARTKILKGDLI